MNRRTLVLPALVGFLAPLLAACGTSAQGDDEGGAIVVGTTDAMVATKDYPAPLDPALAYDVGSWNILYNTAQTLMALPRSGGDPVPEAAEKCGFTDRRNEAYRCTLRDGLKFANGHALTSEDVKFSIDRSLAIKDPNGPSSLLSNIDAVETPSDTQVVFQLKTPDATFPYKLSTPAAAIVDSQAYDKNKLRDGFRVDASGPYSLRVKKKGDHLVSAVFQKNPKYHGSRKVKNSKVEMRFFPDANAMEDALKKGDIDLMTRSMTPSQITRLDQGGDKDIQLVEMPGQEIRYLAFNTDDPTVGKKAVRQAMAEVIDRQALVRDVYQRTAKPLYSLIPTNVSSHINSFFNKYGDPDVTKARQTLNDAGVSTPVQLTLTYTSDHYGSVTADEFKKLQSQLNRSGLFDVKIKGVPWKTFRPALTERKYPAYGMGWFPDFPDPDNFIAPFFAKDNFLNSPYRSDTIRSQLIPQTRQEALRTSAAKDFAKAQDIIADDVPVLPLWQGNQYVAARNSVTGVEWALNSSSTLQLWELGRGTTD